MGFVVFKINVILIRTRIADTVVVNDVSCSRENAITRAAINFFDTMLSTEYQRHHINIIIISVIMFLFWL